jgi:hypothetical protein
MMRSTLEAQLDALAETLWGERRLVEYLLFKLVTAKLLLAADERRFLTMAMDEVETVLARLREHEVMRAMALEPLASAWGLPGESLTLTELTQRVPPPYESAFRDHQQAFRRMAEEIEDTTAANRQLAANGLGQLRQTLDAMAGRSDEPATYTAAGQTSPLRQHARLDRVL